MNPYRYDRPSGAREHENMNTIPFPPFPLDPVEEIEKNTFSHLPMRLQGLPPQYPGAQGRLSGYPVEAGKYATAARDKMDFDPVTHTHHHPYMENSLRPHQPILYNTTSRLALTAPPNTPCVQSTGQADGFAASAAASLGGPSHPQERSRPFYGSVPQFGLHTQGPELSTSAQEQARHVSHELQDTGRLPSSRPGSFATLATLTAKGNVATSQGIDSGDEHPGDMDMYYPNNGAPGMRSNPGMISGINPALPAHPLQNVAGVETGGHHGHSGELISHYHHLNHSPQRAHNLGQHAFSVDPGASHYPASAYAPPIPRPVPHMSYAKHVKHATISAPATSAPTPAPKTRPASPTGPFIPGPDSISPTKQEEKFNIQRAMLERLGEKSLKDALDVDFSKLSVGQADHYLDLIGAHPRPKPEVENVENATGQPNGTNKGGDMSGPKVTSQGLTLGKPVMETLSSLEHQPPHCALSAVSAHNYANDTARGAIPAAANHNLSGQETTLISRFHREELESAMARVGASPLMLAPSRMPSSDSMKRDAADDFESPAWDVSNLRKAGLIPPTAPGPSETKNSTPKPLATHQDIPPTNYTGPQFGRYIGGHVSMKPSLLYHPVPWSMDTPEEAEKKAKKTEASPEADKHSPGLPHPPTLGGSPVGNKRCDILFAKEKNARIGETLKWYRADHRWNEGLRKRLDVIMKENKESHDNAKATTTNSKEIYDSAEQNTALLAQAIVNLQSYLEGNPKDQLGNFAPYGPVPDECCEPSKDGNFSLFDVQPGPFMGPEAKN